MFICNTKKQKISFKALKYEQLSGVTIPKKFKVSLPNDFGDSVDCFVKHKVINNQRFKDYSLSITNDEDIEVGHCLFDYLDYGKFHISAINSYNNKLKGVGSVLHLTQIISMLKNNAKETLLYSIGSAINFHAKFGYKADVQTLAELKSFLIEEIAMKYPKDGKFSGTIERITKWFGDKNTTENKKLKEGNKIIDEFIKFINKNHLRYPDIHIIKTGINMRLTKDNVIKNKEYYNKLFDKYCIEYNINN